MKTIEEKAKAYNKVREKIALRFGSNVAEEIFSEFEESEDERISKALIHLVNSNEELYFGVDNYDGIKWSDILAWLEKKGGQKSAVEMKTPEKSLGIDSETYNEIVDECIYGKKEPADKVEPKFHEGDWIITNKKHVWYVDETPKTTSYLYRLVNQYGKVEVAEFEIVDKKAKLWTIQDAKDGDVLCCESGWTCIFKALDEHTNTFSSYCFMDNDKWFCNTGSEGHTLDKAFIKAYNGEIHPATKEQHDTLMKAMADAGYTFDFEKKELKKIEQKPAWSEEDEQYLLICKNALTKYQTTDKWDAHIIFNWLENKLKSLIPMNNSVEWSMEDEEELEIALDTLKKAGQYSSAEWLKNVCLVPQSHWKPSEEQMKALASALSLAKNCGEESSFDLRTLYEQLKKLK